MWLKHRLSTLMIVITLTTFSPILLSCAFSSPSTSAIIPSHTKSSHTKTYRLYASTTKSYKRGKPMFIEGPSLSSKPDYSSINGPLGPMLDKFLTILFRAKMSSRLSQKLQPNEIVIPDSSIPRDDFNGIIEITHAMNSQYNNRTAVHSIAQDILVSLFPPFILDRYPSWFARPFPEFSSKMCAFATVVFGTWLMGECEVNDIPSKGQGVLVKRCRFLEESQCASICVNSCKVSQNLYIGY